MPPSSSLPVVRVRPLDVLRDHATIVPIWQRGFLELAPDAHRIFARYALPSLLGVLFAGSALTLGPSPRALALSGLALAVLGAALAAPQLGGRLMSALLWRGILRETARDMTPEGIVRYFQRRRDSRSASSASSASNDDEDYESEFLVAEVDGAVVGCVAVITRHALFKEARAVAKSEGRAVARVDPRDASVWRLSVAPEARRLGVGRILMAAAEAWARAHACTRISLITGNVQSQTFYRRIGYGQEVEEHAARVLFVEGAPKGALGWLRLRMLRLRLTSRGSIMLKLLDSSEGAPAPAAAMVAAAPTRGRSPSPRGGALTSAGSSRPHSGTRRTRT